MPFMIKAHVFLLVQNLVKAICLSMLVKVTENDNSIPKQLGLHLMISEKKKIHI